MNIEELDLIARKMRHKLIDISHKTKTAHLGGSLSCVDILVAAYWTAMKIDPKKPDDPKRDRLILSKGHAVSSLYTALAMKGFFPEKELDGFNAEGGHLPEHPSPNCSPGVEWATGSLGHGLGVGIGMALASKIQNNPHRVFVVMSDGECQEGSVWEAAMFAPRHRLSHLTAIVDYNKWQATGRSNEVMNMDPLKSKWGAFGWRCFEVNGHNLKELVDALNQPEDADGRPTAIVAHTVKGKGASFMEDDNNWHYRSPSAEEVEKAKVELELV